MQLGEHLGDLAHEVLAVRALERAHALAIPACDHIVDEVRGRRHHGVEAGIEEERHRQPVATGLVAHAVRCGAIAAIRQALEHVAEVAHERARDRRRLDPAIARADLEATAVVLREDREQAVVGVLADAPRLLDLLARRRRIVEDPEQGQRICEVARAECIFGVPERDAERAHHDVAELRARVDMREHRSRRARRSAREQVAAMQRRSGSHARIVVGELGAKVDALFPVRGARGQLAAERKVAAPRPAAARHRDRELCGDRLREELTRLCLEPGDVDAMAGQVEEPTALARVIEARDHGRAVSRARDQRRDVHDWDRREIGAAGHTHRTSYAWAALRGCSPTATHQRGTATEPVE